MSSLPELQARFAAALHGDAAPVAAEVAGDGLEPAGRLRIYENNSRAMFDGALERSYPVLRRRVGADYFRQLAHGYRQRYPSQSGDLHWVGRHFPDYLARTEAGSGYEWLAELAALEWACEAALAAAREPPIGVEALAGSGAAELGETRLRLQPSLRLIASAWPLLDVWRANQPGADGKPVDLTAGGQRILVSCSDTGLELREVSAAVFEFTRALWQGATLGEAVDQSGMPPASLAGALGALFAAGLVTGAGIDTRESEA